MNNIQVNPTFDPVDEFVQIVDATLLYSLVHQHEFDSSSKFSILATGHSRALQTGLALLPKDPLVLLGISPGNAYFTRKRIEVIICGLAQLFSEIIVVIPDSISTHTYLALGYPVEQAPKKARREGNSIKNRCLQAIQGATIQSPDTRIQLCEWDRDIATLPGYLEAYREVCQLFDTHPDFQREVLNKGRSVLQAKMNVPPSPEAVREGIEYLLKEFAYMKICRQVFGRDLIIPYHQDFRLGQHFCDGEYQAPFPGVGWAMYSVELANEM